MPNFFSSSQDVVNIWDYLSLRFGVVQGLQGLMGPLNFTKSYMDSVLEVARPYIEFHSNWPVEYG